MARCLFFFVPVQFVHGSLWFEHGNEAGDGSYESKWPVHHCCEYASSWHLSVLCEHSFVAFISQRYSPERQLVTIHLCSSQLSALFAKAFDKPVPLSFCSAMLSSVMCVWAYVCSVVSPLKTPHGLCHTTPHIRHNEHIFRNLSQWLLSLWLF